jgi:hypothetical protein
MNKFLVPQFIEVESQIIGSITVRQFAEMVVAAILIFVAKQLFSFIVFIVVTIFIVVIVGALAFGNVNGNPMHFFLLNMVYTMKRPKIRLWLKKVFVTESDVKEKEIKKVVSIIPEKTVFTKTHLSDLSLLVDTGGAYEMTAYNKSSTYDTIKKE